MIEVERKFVPCAVGVVALLADARPLGPPVRELRDEYWDTPRADLMRHDLWLRLRNASWQLKVKVEAYTPAESNEKSVKGGIDRYEEVDDVSRIVSLVARAISAANGGRLARQMHAFDDKNSDADAIFRAAGLSAVAAVCTRRKSYLKPFRSSSVRIDIDESDFGYAVGELELLVEHPDECPRAERILDELANEYALSSHTPPSKLAVYLEMRNPRLYHELHASGLL